MSLSLRYMIRIALLISALQASALMALAPTRLMVDLSATPDAVMLSAFNLCIVDNAAVVDLEAQHSLGNQMLARVNVLEIRQNSPEALAAQSVGIPLLESTRPGYVRLDATHPHWIPLVVYEIIQNTAEKGFDGFVLTGLETISQDAVRAACLKVIAELDKVYPDKQLVIEGGFDLIAESRRALEGALFLGPQGTEEERDQRIREVKRLGVRPLVVDYAPPGVTRDEIIHRTQHLCALGAVPYFTTPELNGLHLGPLNEVMRRVLVIHSGATKETFTARVLQGSLEWLGYQAHYVAAPAASGIVWENEVLQAAAVILDASLKPLPAHQPALLAMVSHLKKNHTPLLITGIPWGSAEDFAPWASKLGFKGSGQSLPLETPATIRQIQNDWLQDSGVIRPRTQGFRDLQAPSEARILSSIKAGIVFDQAFLTSWGGLWLDPQATVIGPQLKPFKILNAWLGQKALAPVMDVASQNGRRLMVPTISSEGFTQLTTLKGLPIAGEAMTSRILSRYSLPFTVGICEGDIRSTNPGLDPREALRYEAAARSLFALPQVHAASASRTRPQDWANCLDMEREIAGSLAYLHRQILPAGRHMELMLWPEGSLPSPASVAFSRRMGVENLQPLFDRPQPCRTSPPAPMLTGQKDTHQTLAPSPRQPGPLNANTFIARANTVGDNRWMAPLHVALNFQDAHSEGSLWEVERVLDWCAAQPFHAMSAADHARLVRDAAQTRLFHQGPGHWIIVNAGHARTLRLPASAGLPNLSRCIGIAGYTLRGEDLYVHTLGRRRTELVLSAGGSPDYLRLASSSGEVRYLEAGQQRALLQVSDLRPVELAFEGIQPGAICQISTTEQPQFITADAHGRVEVTVSAQTTLRLQVLPLQQAAMR